MLGVTSTTFFVLWHYPFYDKIIGEVTLYTNMTTPPAHSARLTVNFLTTNRIPVLDWQSLSPDISPIVHIWVELGRCIGARRQLPWNVNELTNALINEWNNIPQQVIANLVLSMRRRCTACIAANGSYIRY